MSPACAKNRSCTVHASVPYRSRNRLHSVQSLSHTVSTESHRRCPSYASGLQIGRQTPTQPRRISVHVHAAIRLAYGKALTRAFPLNVNPSGSTGTAVFATHETGGGSCAMISVALRSHGRTHVLVFSMMRFCPDGWRKTSALFADAKRILFTTW